jgi:hypothetical protein
LCTSISKKKPGFGLGKGQTVCATFVKKVIKAGGKTLKGWRGGDIVRRIGATWKGIAGGTNQPNTTDNQLGQGEAVEIK